jgi:diguanylate cyclase (GGDEF)-like protein
LAKTIRRGQRESIYLGVAMSLLSITAAVLLGILVLRPINTLQEQARQDPLTGLLNRRSFDQFSDKKIAIAIRGRHPLSALMIDVDYFKPINDEYGHAVGDEVLQIVARRINRGLSDDDLLSRYGGEEFAVLLPDAALDQAVVIAERLREQVGSSPIKTSAATLSVTVSLGVAQFDDTDESIAQLLERADRRLLIAKRRGRDCVVYDDQPGSQ